MHFLDVYLKKKKKNYGQDIMLAARDKKNKKPK